MSRASYNVLRAGKGFLKVLMSASHEKTAQRLDVRPKRTDNKHIEQEDLEVIVQELCESRGGRPGLSVLTSLLVSVDVKQY